MNEFMFLIRDIEDVSYQKTSNAYQYQIRIKHQFVSIFEVSEFDRIRVHIFVK